jgi:predicted nucleic acid-binding protein
MPTKPFLAYWDSCVFISAIERTPGRIQIIDSLREHASLGKVLIVTSSIIMTEVIKFVPQGKTLEFEMQQISDYLENPWITRRVADNVITTKAGYIRRQFNLKLADAIHLATAWHYEVDQLHTYDTDLLKCNNKLSFEKKKSPLKICHPEIPDTKDYPLFESH